MNTRARRRRQAARARARGGTNTVTGTYAGPPSGRGSRPYYARHQQNAANLPRVTVRPRRGETTRSSSYHRRAGAGLAMDEARRINRNEGIRRTASGISHFTFRR